MTDWTYRIELSFEPDTDTFRARCPELGATITGSGPTRDEALKLCEAAIEGFVQNLIHEGKEIPKPLHQQTFSGDLAIQVSPEIHRDLAEMAAGTELSPVGLATELLIEAVAQRRGGRSWDGDGARRGGAPGGMRMGGGGGARSKRLSGADYHKTMADPAEFLSYVRAQEEQQGAPRPNGGGGGGGGGAGGGGGPPGMQNNGRRRRRRGRGRPGGGKMPE